MTDSPDDFTDDCFRRAWLTTLLSYLEAAPQQQTEYRRDLMITVTRAFLANWPTP